MKRFVLICLVAVMSLLMLPGCSASGVPTKETIIAEFKANSSLFYGIAAYMAASNSKVLDINKDKDNNFIVGVTKDEAATADIEAEIKAKGLDGGFHTLFDMKYYSVLNGVNAVFFIRISQEHFESGIVYCIDGLAPGYEYFTKLEKIEDNFFYYEGRF